MSESTPGTGTASASRSRRDVVVVGASAGGVEALTRFVAGLPADLAATVLVVLHIPASGPSALPAILTRAGALPARAADVDEALVPGRILVAPPDHHLVITDAGATVTRGPRENGHRPAIDALFRTAAWHLGPRVIAVVLSGTDDDGTAGSVAVNHRGGRVLVQSADDALYPIMPASVARATRVAGEGPPDALAARVTELVGTRPEAQDLPAEPDESFRRESAMSEDRTDAVLADPTGEASGYVCPDCSGALFTVEDVPVLRFRCRIGHAWTADGLVRQQNLTVETALWTAVRTLDEKADLATRLAHRAKDDGRRVSENHFHESAREARQSAAVLKEFLETSGVHHDPFRAGDVDEGSTAWGAAPTS